MRNFSKILSAFLLLFPAVAFANGAKEVVNINQDGAWEFHDDLTGVTNQLAENIVKYRNKHGDFTSKSQLLNVPGFGRDLLNMDRYYMSLKKEPQNRGGIS